MSKILFLNQPSVGHLNTLLSIASQMKEDGHEVRFLVPGIKGVKTGGIPIFNTGIEIPKRIERNGIHVDFLLPPFSLIYDAFFLPFKSGYEETAHAFTMFFKGIKHFSKQIVKQIEKDRPDIIVTDFAFPASSLAADIANIPYVVIYHSGLPFRGKGIPPFGSGQPIGDKNAYSENDYVLRENRILNNIDKLFHSARRAFGLQPIASDVLRRPYSPWLNLIASTECIEAPRLNLTGNTYFVGPCFGKRSEPDGFLFNQLRSDKYKVYVSLGTVFNNKPDIFKKIMLALDKPEYQVIISAGGAYEKLRKGPIPKNVTIYKSVPQISLLSNIDLFISHGGNNSVNEALASGKPVIVMPVGGEQADNASRIVYLGVGKRIDMKRFSDKELISIVEEIRQTPAYRERALNIMNTLRFTKGEITASRCIAWVAQNRKPLNNQKGFPLTITPDCLEQLLA